MVADPPNLTAKVATRLLAPFTGVFVPEESLPTFVMFLFWG
jgi:hypothetical protein